MGKKRKSRRQPARKKFKVKKKIKEHQKKVRKMAKKLSTRKRIKKDPGIPNLWPEKQRMLERIQKSQTENELEMEREKLEKQRNKMGKEKMLSVEQEMFKLGYDSMQKQKDFKDRQNLIREQGDLALSNDMKNITKQTTKFYKDFKEVVKMSNIIIMVLDARDPLGCRSTQIEKQVLSQNKKLILLLNKIDLVPQEVVQKWLDYLREEYPTYPFKSNTQKQKYNLGEGRTPANVGANEASAHLRFGGKCLGRENLIKVLKRYSKTPSEDIKKSITVGIIGFPNVGKSSVINSLKGKKVANVGNKPGITTKMAVFKYDKNIQFVDCPGIIFSQSSIDSDIILRNAVQIDKLEDTITPVDLIRKRCTNERLMKKYDIPYFKTTEEFLARLAFKKGKLLKGGKPNLNEIGKMVLKDWNSGRIPFFTLPPNRPRFLVKDDVSRAEIKWGVVEDNSVLKKIKTFQDREMENLIPMLSSLSI